jgi:hypothetical protein
MKKLLKFATLIYGLKMLFDLLSENTSIKNQIDRLKEEITKLETDDLENKLKDFFKKYDPKFKDDN